MSSSEKRRLRTDFRARRRAIEGADRRELEAAIHAGLSAHLGQRGPCVIGVYAATGGEVSLDVCYATWASQGHALAWPKVGPEGVLTFYRGALSDLRPGYRGIREPASSQKTVLLADLDLLLVPGVAFTRRGQRLGQGGGFYDRLLASPEIRGDVFGVAFECQVASALPTASLDRPVHAIVTEIGWTPAPPMRAL